MAEAKKGRKRQTVVDAEAPIPAVPGQGELFEGASAAVVAVTDAMPSEVPPAGSPSAGQDLLSAAQATPQKRRKAP